MALEKSDFISSFCLHVYLHKNVSLIKVLFEVTHERFLLQSNSNRVVKYFLRTFESEKSTVVDKKLIRSS